MAKYRLSESADRDLDKLYVYGVLNFGLTQAERYIDGLIRRFDELTNNPYLYQAVDDIRPGYRRSVYKSHAIYYRIESDIILIVRILGHQDPERSL